MKIRSGIICTAQQRVFTWESYQKSSPLNNIARLFEWQHSSVSRLISEHADIRSNNKKRPKNHLMWMNEKKIFVVFQSVCQ
jgi:hypothetical protein